MLTLASMLALSLTACGGKSGSDTADNSNTSDNTDTADSIDAPEPDEDETDSDTSATTKSDGYEKFSQLEIGMTEDQVNEILGEPVGVDKAYYYYNITVNGKDCELEIWINTVSGLVTYISGDFISSEYRAEFADTATDLSAADDLEDGELNTYDACVSAFKTPGYLTNIDEDGTKSYLWVNACLS